MMANYLGHPGGYVNELSTSCLVYGQFPHCGQTSVLQGIYHFYIAHKALQRDGF